MSISKIGFLNIVLLYRFTQSSSDCEWHLICIPLLPCSSTGSAPFRMPNPNIYQGHAAALGGSQRPPEGLRDSCRSGSQQECQGPGRVSLTPLPPKRFESSAVDPRARAFSASTLVHRVLGDAKGFLLGRVILHAYRFFFLLSSVARTFPASHAKPLARGVHCIVVAGVQTMQVLFWPSPVSRRVAAFADACPASRKCRFRRFTAISPSSKCS